ncbi:MAG: cupin domain-containing protein [Sandaracinaceae bacterium]
MPVPPVRRVTALPTTQSIARSSGEALGQVADLGEVLGLSHLRCHYEVLEPGRRMSRPHHHTRREECVYVIAGHPTLLWGGASRGLGPGDVVALPAGPPAHSIHNEADHAASLWVVSATPEEDRVVFAPTEP